MKVNTLETHDRLKDFTNKDFDISACCENLVKQRPFGNHPFYIFAHARTDDDSVTKRLIWQPRLTKPKAQTNSMLFKGYPGSDKIKIIWIIPDRPLWKQYEKGLMLENQIVSKSIFQFQHQRHLLEKKDDDDLADETIDFIYKELSKEARLKKKNAPSSA